MFKNKKSDPVKSHAEWGPNLSRKMVFPSLKANLSWLERIDNIHCPGYMNWISTSWAMMFIKQGIILAKDASEVARVVMELWEYPGDPEELAGPHTYGIDGYYHKALGDEVGGRLMMARTQPSTRQVLAVRHQLMKQMCRIYDLEEAILDLAEQHAGTIMPGYTHFRHAQPTTFGHYLLSVHDPIERSMKTLEHGYHLMSLNEMGCGALAGTSWPIDRELVSQYLGMEGLIENANDAVSYADGFLVVVSGLTNITTTTSRIALDLSYWSGVEYGFLDIGSNRGTSFMMPQKDGNPNSMETVRQRASQMIGHLTSVAVAGLRAPHGDVFEMLNLAEPVLAALETAEKCTSELTNEVRNMKVHKERMLELIRESYLASTELANQMVRDYKMGYRTAHDIVHEFVLMSQDQKIPATNAKTELLDEAARKKLGRKLGMTEARLRELLDPAYFIKATNSRGGVAPDEIDRMINDRRQKLADARDRHLKRIESLENAQEKMMSDLRGLYET
jgi:argininosuccinate lyase